MELFWLPFEVIVAFLGLALGIALLVFSSSKAGEHSISLATALGASPFIIGILLVSIGTDLPEIANSITSSVLGHGNINVGDSLGSILTQMTLVIGLASFLGGTLRSHDRRMIVIIGATGVLSLFFFVSMTEKGYISRLDGILLVSSWPIFMLISRYVTQCCSDLEVCMLRERSGLERGVVEKTVSELKQGVDRRQSYHLAVAILGFAGVAIGAHFSVVSVITLSASFHIPEYLISFFVLGFGTSLPEIMIDLWAARRKYYDLLLGDVIGSCIVDATLSIGIGPIFSPIKIWGNMAKMTGVYTIFAFLMIFLMLSLRMKLDKKIGVLSIVLYILSFVIFYVM
jgi:cation:H+ antiporter